MHFDSDMRAFAHDLVDRLFDHVEQIDSRPVVDWKSAPELRALLRDTNDPIQAILDHSIQLHHPSYMGHQVCPPFPSAILGDLLISTLNQSTAVWEMSPIGTVIEQELLRWLADRAGYPAESLGTAVSGGSAANLTGLLAARARWNAKRESGVGGGESEQRPSPTPDPLHPTPSRPLVLCSADAHYSIARAASIMGI